jgi:hypothetical protein
MEVNSYRQLNLFFMPYGYEDIPEELYGEDYKDLLKILNIAGYIPIIGTLSGLSRAITAISDYGDLPPPLGTKAFRISMVLRGAIETCGIGSSFLIVDIIAALARKSFPSNQAAESNATHYHAT